MNSRHSFPFALGFILLAVGASACGSSDFAADGADASRGTADSGAGDSATADEDASDSNPGNPDKDAGAGDSAAGDSATGDVIPPTILSATPADGATKLKDDVEIVITFSEPMDQAKTEAAFSIDPSSKTHGPPTYSWNAEGTVLTIDPMANYSSGRDLAAVPAVPLKFALDTGATDLAGNALVKGMSASVSLYRLLFQEAPRHATLFGNSCEGVPTRGSFIGAGDCPSDVERRGYVSFVLPAMPSGAELLEALLTAKLAATSDEGGNPFVDFGSMYIEHVSEFKSIESGEAYDEPTLHDLGEFVAADPAPTVGQWIEKDVKVAVADDYASGRANSQYRLRFKSHVPKVDGKSEMAYLKNADGDVKIVLSFLVE
ncbi:MAG: Ig-like domain-containing protein [Sorangiineae bacterium]|nr:Ig-like domain-containing protein [Polyangiaceae bacterium]MEB2325143.1 Ig-like domain-containing protein [Sorangiineae bacterium]